MWPDDATAGSQLCVLAVLLAAQTHLCISSRREHLAQIIVPQASALLLWPILNGAVKGVFCKCLQCLTRTPLRSVMRWRASSDVMLGVGFRQFSPP
jgi:predicted membrane protein